MNEKRVFWDKLLDLEVIKEKLTDEQAEGVRKLIYEDESQ